MYFSDVYAERELSEEVRKHKVLWGMYTKFDNGEYLVHLI